ncbi:hypothetical protein [Glycomyces algeriensis]|uniref:Uncharacterized protein n=1 Tax=Glycomyces algeriensis TaxID=256037 RepID=A0A9W6GDM9_9ACTN|nr:hypothetical protein [Glycomyces algeriensis]MDA1367859.1 hypothetical protein [Glycomyces algeriensis]MDR7352005.1 hypothetical protein [Glycomyces algeriensis]GLI44738.1 hypothetical protein GALLR39Z86_45880 [Glycomyces algeriensis]
MEKIDWFGTNARSAKKYAALMGNLDGVRFAFEDVDKAITDYVPEGSSGAWQAVEKEVLKKALQDAFGDLASLRVAIVRHESKLKTWEWSL